MERNVAAGIITRIRVILTGVRSKSYKRPFLLALQDTLPYIPIDYQPAPQQLAGIKNDTLRDWAFGINGAY